MQDTTDIGKRIKFLRKSRGETLVQLSKAVKIERSYLNKIELGQIKPSVDLLNRIIVHFSMEGNIADSPRQLLGQIPLGSAMSGSRKEVEVMLEQKQPAQMTQVSMSPQQTPVLYTDSTFVSASEYGLVLDVAQTINNGLQQNIVSRIGMSFDHAKKLIEVIQDTIEKNER